MSVQFVPLNDTEREELQKSLLANAERGVPLHMDPKNTTFVPTNRIAHLLQSESATAEVTDEEVINAIVSVPCHYAR